MTPVLCGLIAGLMTYALLTAQPGERVVQVVCPSGVIITLHPSPHPQQVTCEGR